MTSQAERNLQILRPTMLPFLADMIDIDFDELAALPSGMVTELLSPVVYDEVLKRYIVGMTNFLLAVEAGSLPSDAPVHQAVDRIWRFTYVQRNRPLPKESLFAIRLARLQDNLIEKTYDPLNLSPNRKAWHDYYDAVWISSQVERNLHLPSTNCIEQLLKEQYPGMFVYGTASGGRCLYAAITNFKAGWEQFLLLMLLATGVLKQTSSLPLRNKDAAELGELAAAFNVILTFE